MLEQPPKTCGRTTAISVFDTASGSRLPEVPAFASSDSNSFFLLFCLPLHNECHVWYPLLIIIPGRLTCFFFGDDTKYHPLKVRSQTFEIIALSK